MKKNEKAKKQVVSKTSSSSKKPVSSKAPAKAAAKAPVKKVVSKVSKTAKPVAKKAAPVKAAAKSAPKAKAVVAKAPAKKAPVKAAPKKAVVAPKASSVKKPVAVKAAPKAKAAVKAPAKAVTKVAVKPAVKAAPAKQKAPVQKVVAKAAAPKVVQVKAPATPAPAKKADKKIVDVAKQTPAPVTAKPAAPASPILVKMPQNQNLPTISSGSAKPLVTMAPQKQPSLSTMGSSQSSLVRPAYRPIQVINRPLTPVQPVRQMAPVAQAESEKPEFKKGDYVCYPAHGVGEIEAVESQIIGGVEIKLYTIAFEKDRMRLKVPVAKAHASGLRRLSSSGRMEDALKTLQGRAHVRRAMWSRRAQEYETKINSGDPVSIAEVLRDLKRSNDETEQSYSERQIYQSALERLAREVAAVEKISEEAAAERLENMIKGRKAKAAAEKKEEEEAA